MEQKASNKGILGVIADVVKVEKKYETAIETAMKLIDGEEVEKSLPVAVELITKG